MRACRPGRSRPAREHIAAACLDHYGQIDGLVNNAAVVRHKPLGEWDMAGFDEHVATNVRAPFFLIQAALPALRESGVRAVVNISSSSGTLHRVGQSVYAMTKSALRLPDPHPGWRAGSARRAGERHRARPHRHAYPCDVGGGPGRGLPLARRPGTAGPDRHPGGGALWILLLLSPAASFLTGAVIPLDGGQVIDRE